jgi:hypothetical protein
METPKGYYYTYYSYEEWGRGYIGSRGCKCLPEEDVKYLGSSKDKTFKPTQKIILKDDYATREEAYADEIILQQYYKVVENPHFANKAYQTTTKFYYTDGSNGGKKAKKLGLGVHSLTVEELSVAGKKGGNKTKELGIGLFGMPEEERKKARSKGAKKAGEDNKRLKRGIFASTKEERIEIARKAGNKSKELGVGIHALTHEERSENAKMYGFNEEDGKKYGKQNVELKRGIFGMTDEELYNSRKRGGEVSGKKTSSQRWVCEETGFITNSGALTNYQKARGIDTSKRHRIS